MFWSYTLKDVVEIEPVYFPSPVADQSSEKRSNEMSVTASGGSVLSPSLPNVVMKACCCAENNASKDGHDLFCSTTKIEEIEVKPIVASSISIWSDLILHRLTERYVGKVVPRLGFCLAVEHVLEYSPCEVKGPHGSAWLTAVFDICLFAPVPFTRFRAKIVGQDEGGIILCIDFFASYRILVPPKELVDGSAFDKVTGRWFLPVTENDEEKEAIEGDSSAISDAECNNSCNFYLHQEDVVAKVVSCYIVGGESNPHNTAEKEELMSITASFQGDCLGPISWFEDIIEEQL